MLDSPDPKVRLAAIPAIAELPPAEAAPLLRRLVADPDPDVRRAGVDAIEHLVPKDKDEAIKLYKPLVTDADAGRAIKSSRRQLSRLVEPPPTAAASATPPPAPPSRRLAAEGQGRVRRCRRGSRRGARPRPTAVDALVATSRRQTAQPANDDAAVKQVEQLATDDRRRRRRPPSRRRGRRRDGREDRRRPRPARARRPMPPRSSPTRRPRRRTRATAATDARTKSDAAAKKARDYAKAETDDPQMYVAAADAAIATGNLADAKHDLDKAAPCHGGEERAAIDYSYAPALRQDGDREKDPAAKRKLLEQAKQAYETFARTGSRLARPARHRSRDRDRRRAQGAGRTDARTRRSRSSRSPVARRSCRSTPRRESGPQCNDGLDNDGNGLIDCADPRVRRHRRLPRLRQRRRRSRRGVRRRQPDRPATAAAPAARSKHAARCGDGQLDPGEECDDGNTDRHRRVPVDAATPRAAATASSRRASRSATTATPSSGDGCARPARSSTAATASSSRGEQCDDGNDRRRRLQPDLPGRALRRRHRCSPARSATTATPSPATAAAPTCTIERCGDGIVADAEQNATTATTVSGDGCSATCTLESLRRRHRPDRPRRAVRRRQHDLRRRLQRHLPGRALRRRHRPVQPRRGVRRRQQRRRRRLQRDLQGRALRRRRRPGRRSASSATTATPSSGDGCSATCHEREVRRRHRPDRARRAVRRRQHRVDGDGCSATCQIETLRRRHRADVARRAVRRRQHRSTATAAARAAASRTCGDGIVADRPSSATTATPCRATAAARACKLERCGDGVVQAALGEQCDDGNTDLAAMAAARPARSRAAATASSQPGLGEQCDDGNTDNTDGCVAGCKLARCGDGFVEAGVEECDDGNTDGERRLQPDAARSSAAATASSRPGPRSPSIDFAVARDELHDAARSSSSRSTARSCCRRPATPGRCTCAPAAASTRSTITDPGRARLVVDGPNTFAVDYSGADQFLGWAVVDGPRRRAAATTIVVFEDPPGSALARATSLCAGGFAEDVPPQTVDATSSRCSSSATTATPTTPMAATTTAR